jgi:hypothetical protein
VSPERRIDQEKYCFTVPLICREEQGKFPDYPSDEEGGSAAVFHPETVLQVTRYIPPDRLLQNKASRDFVPVVFPS